MAFASWPKDTRHPVLKSIGDRGDGAGLTTGFDSARFEKTKTREPYGGRSSPTVIAPGDRVSTSADTTRPENGSHHSGCSPRTRKVAFTLSRAFDVLARK